MSYPVRVFHEKEKPLGIVIHSDEERKSLGTGWVDSPAKFKDKSVVEFEPKDPQPLNEGEKAFMKHIAEREKEKEERKKAK